MTQTKTTKALLIMGLLTACLWVNKIVAQQQHEVSVYNYSLLNTEKDVSGYSLGFGLSYSYALNNPQWRVSLGASYQYSSSKVSFSTLTESHNTTDSENDKLEFRYTAKDYREEQQLGMLMIPLQLQWETKGRKGVPRFYVSGGLGVAVPIKQRFQSEAASLKTTGYYPEQNVILEEPKFAGFGSWGAVKSPEMDLDINTLYFALLEAGVKYRLSEHSSVYIAAFTQQGINAINNKSETATTLIEYQPDTPVAFRYHSVLEASSKNTAFYAKEERRLSFIGIKVKYGFRW